MTKAASCSSESRENQIVEVATFPFNVFDFKSYNGLKISTLFVFLLSLFYFVMGLTPHHHWWNSIPLVGWTVDAVSFSWHFLLLTISYCLLWLAFDTKGFLGYAMGAFTFMFGLLYIFSPTDFSPDIIPVLGGLDDAVIGGLSIALETLSWNQTQQQDRTYSRALKALREGNQQAAIRFFLEERGIETE